LLNKQKKYTIFCDFIVGFLTIAYERLLLAHEDLSNGFDEVDGKKKPFGNSLYKMILGGST
jgi:hypothetical protein